MASMRVYRRALPGSASDVSPRLPNVREVKILGLGSLIAACTTYFLIDMRSDAIWPVYLLAALSVIPGLCWIYIKIAKWQ